MCSLHDLNVTAHFASHVVLLDGRGSAQAGPVAEIMTATSLSAALEVDIRQTNVDGRRWFLADHQR
jgi:iron complex transport system ATP-binding protein